MRASRQLGVVLVAGGAALAVAAWSFPFRESAGRRVWVEPSSSTTQVLRRWEGDRDPGVWQGVVFAGYVRVGSWLCGPMQPGLYELRARLRYLDAVSRMCQGQVARFVVPEGWTQARIARALQRRLDLPGDPYLAALAVAPFRHEGRLFPATYPLDSRDPRRLIDRMLRTFEDRTAALRPTEAEVVLASIIQKEGAVVSEFPRISGVFHNRLQKGMKLESDPTLQYVVGRRRLTRDILRNPSPYNSYLHHGLPPGPIGSPGMAALRAAREPERHSYLYFVSKRDGTHHFSTNKRDHFLAVRRFQLPFPSPYDE